MLDGNCPSGAPVRAHRSAAIATWVATEGWQLQGYFALRRRVFVEEQGLFIDSDADSIDAHALAIVTMSWLCGMPDRVVGAVRIYSTEAGLWHGGRLAVDSSYRHHGIVGESLIRAAVCTAHHLGARRFLATIQPRVQRYFERHHFETIGETSLCGLSHALMQANLTKYPPRYYGESCTRIDSTSRRQPSTESTKQVAA